MEKLKLIPVEEFCSHHHVETRFIETLADYGLLETRIVKQTTFLNPDQLPDVEKFVRLHQDLQINPEGLQAIAQLLSQLENMHDKIVELENQLNYYNNLNTH